MSKLYIGAKLMLAPFAPSANMTNYNNTMADVERAKKDATSEAISLSIALFLTVMVDKFGYDADKLKAVWDEINKLSQSVTDGYVNLHDLKQVLIDEYGIEIS